MKFELICIDNWTDREMAAQHRTKDKGSEYMKSIQALHPEMKVISYDTKLSHWQAKNAGVKVSTGDFLWFCDSHCVVYPGSVSTMFRAYREKHKELHGTLHLPLSYMLDAPGRELIYKLSGGIGHGELHYSFTRYRRSDQIYQVPCMSTCGMMMSREIYDDLGGWPTELGIYGGGENFINFTMAVLGYSVNIFPSPPLYHFAEKRGYAWNFDDHLRNRLIATYMWGGYEWIKLFAKNAKGNPLAVSKIMEGVITHPACRDHEQMLAQKRKTDIVEWWKRWDGPQ